MCVGRVMLEHSKAALVIAVSALERRTGIFDGEGVPLTSNPLPSLCICWAGCESKCLIYKKKKQDLATVCVFECTLKYLNHSQHLIHIRHLNWPQGGNGKSSTACAFSSISNILSEKSWTSYRKCNFPTLLKNVSQSCVGQAWCQCVTKATVFKVKVAREQHLAWNYWEEVKRTKTKHL